MKKHISTFALILVIAGLITALVYTGKALIQKDKEIAILNQQNIDLNKSIGELNKRLEDLQDQQLAANVEEKVETEEDTVAIPILDLDKVINKTEGTTLTENIYDNNSIISVSVDNASKSLNISLDAGVAKQIYGYTGQSDIHTIAALSEKIVDVKILNVGKGANYLKLIILTESGKVKYVDISSILDKSYTIKSLDNVENIVRITSVSIENTENSDINYGVVGIKADGTAELLTF